MKRGTRDAVLLVLVAGLLGATGAAAQEDSAGDAEERVEHREVVFGPRHMARVQASGGYLGVGIENVDAEAADELGLPSPRGVRVESVSEESPASEAGIRRGDVIVEFDGEQVRSTRQLARLVRETPPGRDVELRILRDGDRRTVTVRVGERRGGWPGLDEERMEEIHRQIEKARERYGDAMKRFEHRFDDDVFEFEMDGDGMVFVGGRGRLGVRLHSLTDQLADYFGVESGALVASVRDESPAAAAGIRAGDVLVRIGDAEVEDPGDAVGAVRRADAGPVTVTVVRDGDERSFSVELPEAGRDVETEQPEDGEVGMRTRRPPAVPAPAAPRPPMPGLRALPAPSGPAPAPPVPLPPELPEV